MPRNLLICLALASAIGTGCGAPRRSPARFGGNLTPGEYQLLTDAEKTRYKDIVVRVPREMGGVLLPFDAGPYTSPVDKAVHSGDLDTLIGLYNQSMFELEHPRVKIEYLNFDMWSNNFNAALAVSLSSHRAPAYYVARDLPHTIEQGMYADLTPLMRKWDQFSLQPESTVHEGTFNGHLYTLAGPELSATVIRYRKDWFKEAGIFNEKGEPGPPANWTWEDFRRIAKKLTDPARGRYGFAGQTDDFLYNNAHDLDLYIPDPTGRHTWIFNDRDPELLRSLQAVRAMMNEDRSIDTSVSMDWFQWHGEFDAGHAGMIVSWAAHIPRESVEVPQKFGKDKLYADTVGMAAPPHDGTDLSSLHARTNPIGFDPTLSPEQLEAAFEWCKSLLYGDIFINRMRSAITNARILGKTSSLYAELLVLPYKPSINLLDTPFDKVFPKEYVDLYDRIRAAHTVPLPREFGLHEPPENQMASAVRAMYTEAVTSSIDLKTLVAKTADLINTTILNFGARDDRERLRRYILARSDFYRRYFPHYYETKWPEKQQKYFNAGL